MKFGVHIFPTDESVDIGDLAAELEEREFESLWVPEHTHIPISRESPWVDGGDLPREYSRILDPFIALATAAARTQSLNLGTGVCLVAQHDPIILAKTVASLDHVSHGRVLFGVGLGWNLEEMRTHGVDPAVRRSIVREKVMAMEGLWEHAVAGFDGQYVKFEPSWSWPKPVQRPRPPVLIGGAAGSGGIRHIVEFADGWLPDLTMQPLHSVKQKLHELRTEWERAGRDPSTIQVTLVGAPLDSAGLQGLDCLEADRCIFLLPSAERSSVMRTLNRAQQVVADYNS